MKIINIRVPLTSDEMQPLEVFCKKVALKILQNSDKNTKASFSILRKTLRHRCFPLNVMKLLRTTFLQNTSGRLLLSIVSTL